MNLLTRRSDRRDDYLSDFDPGRGLSVRPLQRRTSSQGSDADPVGFVSLRVRGRSFGVVPGRYRDKDKGGPGKNCMSDDIAQTIRQNYDR
jgi:hypothetical protein